jgi:ferredoxin
VPKSFTVEADLDICMGYAMCVLNCPTVFAIDESKTVVVRREFSQEETETVETAVESCPTGALTINWV